jgi:methionyl-tRNA formyltransferase
VPIRIRTHARFDDLAARTGSDLVCLRERPTVATYLAPLRAWQPELILALGWYYLVPREVRAVAPLGCLGIHASLLPKYRGGAPIPWAIINGEARTGVTLFHLEDEVDSGDIVAQTPFAIGSDETCADVIDRATDASIQVLKEALPRLARGTAPRTPQRHEDACWCPQRRPEDGRIDWRWPSRRVHDFVRAQTHPYSGAFTMAGDTRVTVWRSVVDHREAEGPPGAFHLTDGGLVISCGSGAVVASHLGLADRDSCSAADVVGAIGARDSRFDVC